MLVQLSAVCLVTELNFTYLPPYLSYTSFTTTYYNNLHALLTFPSLARLKNEFSSALNATVYISALFSPPHCAMQSRDVISKSIDKQ